MGKQYPMPIADDKDVPVYFPPWTPGQQPHESTPHSEKYAKPKWKLWLKLAGAATITGLMVYGTIALSALTGVKAEATLNRRDKMPAGLEGSCGSAQSASKQGLGLRLNNTCTDPKKPCCSDHGWCGDTGLHCGAGCQRDFSTLGEMGKVCDPFANIRQQPGYEKSSIPYSTPIYHCKKAGTIALTFDDGPFDYTSGLLDLLKEYNAKATFFVTGEPETALWHGKAKNLQGHNLEWTNKGFIDDPAKPWPELIRRMDREKHQIASHTWEHKDLSLLPKEEVMDEMISLEVSFQHILGKIPTYMRPPFSSCTGKSSCPIVLKELQYHNILFDVDSADYLYYNEKSVERAKEHFLRSIKVREENKGDEGSRGGSALVIAHDVHKSSATILAKTMLEEGKRLGWKFVTVGECMEDDEKLWYKQVPKP